MSSGYLKLEGGVPLAGPVEDMGDQVLFRTRTDMTEVEFSELHEGQIEIDGERPVDLSSERCSPGFLQPKAPKGDGKL